MQQHEKIRNLKQKKEELIGLDEAASELEMCDDEEIVQMKFGDSFFHIASQKAKTMIEQ